jgi:uncharacterized phage protein (TIGR02220 family)
VARSRNIKPSFFTNDTLAECDPLARILFAGLWTIADREGRLEYRPKRIKAQILPYDICEVEKLISQLQKNRFLVVYEINDCKYLQILNFSKHQHPHVKELESTIPAPDLSGAKTSLTFNPITLTLNPQPGAKAPNLETPKRDYTLDAKQILTFLNETAGRNYQPVDGNLDFIRARLKDGATVEECKTVVTMKYHEWRDDPKSAKWIRPATLFNKSKFAQYQGEIGARDLAPKSYEEQLIEQSRKAQA